MEGRCLCGAVRVAARPEAEAASVCHCSFCRRWSGAAMWGFYAAAADVRVVGEISTYRSSPFAERAFCPKCGTHLWIRDDGRGYELLPGLFDAASNLPLSREVYADCAFACVPLAGAHERVSRAEYQATQPFVEGNTP